MFKVIYNTQMAPPLNQLTEN